MLPSLCSPIPTKCKDMRSYNRDPKQIHGASTNPRLHLTFLSKVSPFEGFWRPEARIAIAPPVVQRFTIKRK